MKEMFILFCRPVFILCHSLVRGHWCPFTFAFIVLIGLCPLAEGYWKQYLLMILMKIKHFVAEGILTSDHRAMTQNM